MKSSVLWSFAVVLTVGLAELSAETAPFLYMKFGTTGATTVKEMLSMEHTKRLKEKGVDSSLLPKVEECENKYKEALARLFPEKSRDKLDVILTDGMQQEETTGNNGLQLFSAVLSFDFSELDDTEVDIGLGVIDLRSMVKRSVFSVCRSYWHVTTDDMPLIMFSMANLRYADLFTGKNAGLKHEMSYLAKYKPVDRRRVIRVHQLMAINEVTRISNGSVLEGLTKEQGELLLSMAGNSSAIYMFEPEVGEPSRQFAVNNLAVIAGMLKTMKDMQQSEEFREELTEKLPAGLSLDQLERLNDRTEVK